MSPINLKEIAFYAVADGHNADVVMVDGPLSEFSRKPAQAFQLAVTQILRLADGMNFLKISMLPVDGTKIQAQGLQDHSPHAPGRAVVKPVLGFRRLHRRGMTRVKTKWALATLAYDSKRLARLAAA
ncbi:MAG: hypothetical protein L3J36_06865 [Rhodobacteraceae bacterium]|nr:hypothetical protein [Paracoccaceae bacterium]